MVVKIIIQLVERDAIVDYPVHAIDYELVDIFNWQEEAANMYSQMELLRHLSINSSRAIDNKIEKGEITPDLVVQMNENRTLQIAEDLLETLIAHKDSCVGMAANMIGVCKRIIAFDNEGTYMVMFNPEIKKNQSPTKQKKAVFLCSAGLVSASVIRV